MDQTDTPAATRVVEPARKRVKVEQSDDFIELRRRGFELFGSIFLALWLLGWTVGCVFLAGVVITQRDPFMLLFGVPFWASWFAVAGVLVYGVFGFEGMRIDRRGVTSWNGVAAWRFRERHAPLAEVQQAEEARASYEVNDRPVFGIQVRTLGKPVKFGNGLSEDEREWLVALINQKLSQLGQTPSTAEQGPPSAEQSSIANANPALQPSDSEWSLQQFPRGLELIRRGRFRIGEFAGITFVTLFWNSILSVFLCVLFGIGPSSEKDQDLTGGAWWGVFVFLIPFEVAGLALIIAWLASITAPWFREVLSADRNEVRLSRGRFGLGRSRSVPSATLADVIVRKRREKPTQSIGQNPTENEWELVFVDQTSREALRIKSLTEGDARWIAYHFSDSPQRKTF